eukprot:TRINITY_DN684_c8_g1_i1.p1 TRINITY_DN684_c8_g1~~TRINITY_DN684_c8_g1_i1.p1  ORF type:complete len:547 (+),score=97.16 TRINITY_DN684_c8_g1_i1:41-1642(+)
MEPGELEPNGGAGAAVRCVMEVPSNRARTLAKVIACIVKVNDQLYFEPSPEGLVLRVVNSGRTAHFHATFGSGFFTRFEFEAPGDRQVNLQVSCKHFLAPFRGGARGVQALTMQLKPGEDELSVQVETTLPGLTKEYRLTFKEGESDKADDVRGNDCEFRCRPQQLSEVLGHFSAKVDCVQFIATDARFNVSSPDDGGADILSTMLSLGTDTFSRYAVSPSLMDRGLPVPKAFEVKYLRCFVNFCEACQYDVQASFDGGNAPMLFEAKGPDSDGQMPFSAAMLIAAWQPEDSRKPTQTGPSATPRPTRPETPVSIQTFTPLPTDSRGMSTDHAKPMSQPQHRPPLHVPASLVPKSELSDLVPSSLPAPPASEPAAGGGQRLSSVGPPPSPSPGSLLAPTTPERQQCLSAGDPPVKRAKIEPSQGWFSQPAAAAQFQLSGAAGAFQSQQPPPQHCPQYADEAQPPVRAWQEPHRPAATFSLTPARTDSGQWAPAPYDSQVGISPLPEGPTPGSGRLLIDEDVLEPSPSPERWPF